MIVHIDTNVYDHIEKRLGITDADREILNTALRRRQIEVPLSIFNLEELLPLMERSPALALKEIDLVLSIANSRRLLKPPFILLRDDIVAYSRGENSPGPYMTPTAEFQENLKRFRTNPRSIAGMDEVLAQTRQQTAEFVATMTRSREKVLGKVQEVRAAGRRPPTFKRYFEALAEKFAEGFAERAGVLAACKERGINELLAVRSVRVAVGISLSYTYAQTIEGRVPKTGDSRDTAHVILGSSSDVFVVHDIELKRLVERLPVEGFNVMTLPDLLARLGGGQPVTK